MVCVALCVHIRLEKRIPKLKALPLWVKDSQDKKLPDICYFLLQESDCLILTWISGQPYFALISQK